MPSGTLFGPSDEVVSRHLPRQDESRASRAKRLGAFYTEATVANFLVHWAVRSASDTVMDPSFGGGVFLREAHDRLEALGGSASQIMGVEIDPAAHAAVLDALCTRGAVPAERLLLADFFSLVGSQLPLIDAVVGNPPFIRFHHFAGSLRETALRRVAERGLIISRLSSSWLPFVVHSAAMVAPGGRLAMVVPAEVAHAAYARPILNYLCSEFAKVTLVGFRKKLFGDLNESTFLLLAEAKGAPCSDEIGWLEVGGAEDLVDLRPRQQGSHGPAQLPVAELASGSHRLAEYIVPDRARLLYNELRAAKCSKALGEMAHVNIGYVTGSNRFFHLGVQAVHEWKIPAQFLVPAVRRGRNLEGLTYTSRDWQSGLSAGESAYLLHIKADQALPPGVLRYIRAGERDGIHKAYKCRMRSPWYHMPHVRRPDALLTYMSGIGPKLSANDARAVCTNTLHMVHLRPTVCVNAFGLCALWQTSLSALSSEIEGHALGGGMLKVEPSEAVRLLVAWPALTPDALVSLAVELDALARSGDHAGVTNRANEDILVKGMGLSRSECETLSSAATLLRNRRLGRSTAQ